jgi:hypothetical protein
VAGLRARKTVDPDHWAARRVALLALLPDA